MLYKDQRWPPLVTITMLRRHAGSWHCSLGGWGPAFWHLSLNLLQDCEELAMATSLGCTAQRHAGWWEVTPDILFLTCEPFSLFTSADSFFALSSLLIAQKIFKPIQRALINACLCFASFIINQICAVGKDSSWVLLKEVKLAGRHPTLESHKQAIGLLLTLG